MASDDQAVVELLQLHARAQRSGDHAIARLIEDSLGSAEGLPYAVSKSKFMALAQATGVRCPRTVVVGNADILEQELAEAKYPLVVKADGSYGGKGVRIVSSADSARDALQELGAAASWPSAIIRSFDGLHVGPLLERMSYKRPVVTLQHHIVGRCANRAVVCREGVVLGGLSVEALELVCTNGPAAVVRIIEHQEMTDTVATMAKRLKLSGFHGFDFMIDRNDRAWLIELNARITPVSHLALDDGTDLAASLLSAITGTNVQSPSPLKHRTIALFPQALRSESTNRHLISSYCDAPWSELQFVRACLAPQSAKSWTAQLRSRLGIRSRATRPPETSQETAL
ncbi:ATP-grasp domain-containing protein [Bradyrhizobium centrolobii]|uniref:ATP-binding protein n=1 Tax=Bradyrhizobium centrolobii TaxID=1505087 RepID=UPI0010A96248|nr:ATP-grasp domain-containing protein [Bradyrhizobium centrolobii]